MTRTRTRKAPMPPQTSEQHPPGATMTIPLTQGLVAVIDAADEHLVAGLTWHAHQEGRVTYARANTVKADGTRGQVRMHRLILDTDAAHIDHINHDGLDNRRENLRPSTASENARNARAHRDSASPYRGVTWRNGAWEARITVGGVYTRLGRFATAEQARDAYEGAHRGAGVSA